MKPAPLLLALFCLGPGLAQADPEPLGRLFLTPQERQALDRQRLQEPGSNSQRGMTVNGEVRRSGGGKTRWINGRADWAGAAAAPRLPVGDSFDPTTGERQPLLGGGRIVIHPPRR